MPPSALILDGIPSNLLLPEGSRATHVENDLHEICARLRELDPNLRLALIEHVNGNAIWAVMEIGRDGQEHLVVRVGPGCALDALDARVITHIEWIRRIPAADRLATIERDIARERESAAADRSEKLYEDMGGQFYRNLHELGFIQGARTESYNRLTKGARRAGRSIR